MNPVAIEAENFHRYPELAITLPQGCAAIVGPNGAGKSSLLEAIDVALFGGLKDHVTLGETRAHVTLAFEHRGQMYRIRRGVKSGKPTLDLEAVADADPAALDSFWTPLTRENVSATQAAIEELLGITRDTLRASSLLMQGDGAAFTSAKPAERKRLLSDALGLHVWPRLREQAREELRAAERDLAVAQATAERLETEIAGRAQLDTDIVETEHAIVGEGQYLEEAEQALAAVAERYQAARDQAARAQALHAELAAAEQTHRQLFGEHHDATAAAEALRAAREELDQLPATGDTDTLVARERELLAARATYRETATLRAQAQHERDRADHERVEARTTAGALNERAAAVRTVANQKRAAEDATCHTCGQHIADAAKERALAELEATAVECEAKAAACDAEAAKLAALIAEGDVLLAQADKVKPPDEAEYADVVATLAATRAAQQQRARLEERIDAHEQTIARSPDIAERVTGAAAAAAAKRAAVEALEPVDFDAIQDEGRFARARVEQHRAALGHAREQLARLRTRLEAVVAHEANLATVRADAERHHTRIDLLKRAEKAYGPAGIPALILENAAIPQIEAEANRIMAALGWTYTVRLDTQRENASNDGVRDVLDIVIETDLGEQTWERCSGGEQQRVNLALRLAVAELIATRRGVEVKLLAIDEPDGLDADGFQALVDLLHDLEQRGVFEKILVVSHHPELKHAFEQVIEVAGGGGPGTPSRLVLHAEPVAA